MELHLNFFLLLSYLLKAILLIYLHIKTIKVINILWLIYVYRLHTCLKYKNWDDKLQDFSRRFNQQIISLDITVYVIKRIRGILSLVFFYDKISFF